MKVNGKFLYFINIILSLRLCKHCRDTDKNVLSESCADRQSLQVMYCYFVQEAIQQAFSMCIYARARWKNSQLACRELSRAIKIIHLLSPHIQLISLFGSCPIYIIVTILLSSQEGVLLKITSCMAPNRHLCNGPALKIIIQHKTFFLQNNNKYH